MPPIRSILCPTDFSDPAARALTYAIDLARTFGAGLVLLHAVPPTAYPLHNLASISGFPNLRDELRKGIDAELDTLRKKVPSEVPVEVEVREGVPHSEIIDAASERKVDLIVMSTHGHAGLKHALLGSTAERVLRLSPCPVLTMHT